MRSPIWVVREDGGVGFRVSTAIGTGQGDGNFSIYGNHTCGANYECFKAMEEVTGWGPTVFVRVKVRGCV